MVTVAKRFGGRRKKDTKPNADAIVKDLEAYLRIVVLVENCSGRISDWNFSGHEPEIEIEFHTEPGFGGFERHWYDFHECAEVLADMMRKKVA